MHTRMTIHITAVDPQHRLPQKPAEATTAGWLQGICMTGQMPGPAECRKACPHKKTLLHTTFTLIQQWLASSSKLPAAALAAATAARAAAAVDLYRQIRQHNTGPGTFPIATCQQTVEDATSCNQHSGPAQCLCCHDCSALCSVRQGLADIS